ncbi:hypothetical protein JST56_07005, partial [Candidatus Dependentiae bacterium]|nr:hypothetical protein [Candidatus Dependentiae bacterium]
MPQRQFYIDTTTYIVGTTSTEAAAVIDTTVIELYKHSFSDTPSVHPYVTVPNVINANLSNSSWTNSRSMWTNYASNTNMGKAIAFDNSTSDTSTVTLTLNIASGKKVGIKSFSFYNRVSNSGYRHWKMYINGIEVGDSTLYYPATGGTGNNTVKSTGTVQVKNAVENLTGSITVLLKLYDHDAAYPNGNAQGTFRMDDFILNGYVNDDGGSVGSGYQYANKGGYRYGFNGQEKSDEIKGEGNSYTAQFWEMDPRLGRRWNCDPVRKEHESPYAAFSNNPIINVDPYGNSDTTVTMPNGGTMNLPDGAKITSVLNSNTSTLDGSTKLVNVTPGSVSAFEFNGDIYGALWKTKDGSFAGYGKNGSLVP